MKVRLKKPARIHHPAGDIVEVSPAEMNFLLSVGACEVLEESVVRTDIETAEKVPVKRTTSKKK